MSDYITRKVADRLMSEFNTKREDYQKYWKDIHPFVKYGCIRDEKFFSRVKEAIIYRTTAGEFLTAKEYKEKDSYELAEFMSGHTITVGGVVVSPADKRRICDMATGLFWTRITGEEKK